MTDPAAPVPVVLLGGISLVRTLGLAGIPAIVATSDLDEPALASRYCTRLCIIPPLDSGEPAVEALAALGLRLASEHGRRVPLMYGSDDAIELLNTHRTRLQRHFLLTLNDPEVASALIAKDRFQAFARKRGFPVPRALAWEGDGPGTVRGTLGPVVAKPLEKIDWHVSALCHELFAGEGKALVFASGKQAAAHPGVAHHQRQLIFQEHIPGGHQELWSYHGFAADKGTVLGEFTGRKVRTFPAVTGESAYIEIAHDETLVAAGREVVHRCPLKGFFKMDFKRDPTSGKWYLLEINARCSLWHYLGAVNGVNVMRAAYDYLVNAERTPAVRARSDYRWLSFELDRKAYRELAGRGEITFARWVGSLLSSANVYNLFSWRDPLPWVYFWWRRVARRLERGATRTVKRHEPWRATAS